jgi:hypothetical protein
MTSLFWWCRAREVEVVDDGQWLVEQRARLDRAEAVWLARLARFDREARWAADGQLSG